MYRISVLCAVLLLICSSAFAQVSDVASVTALPNGMKIIVREGHSVNLAAVDVWVKAGSVNETAENNGISHLVEHVIFRATKKYGPGQIDRTIEGIGAEINGGTSKDWVHFYTTVKSEYLPVALDVLSDAVMNAKFRPEDIDKERQVVLDEIAAAESDPFKRAFNLFSKTAFSVHPYRLPSTGTRESVGKLTSDDLVKYYDKYYIPANTCVVIAGDVSEQDAVAAVKQAFGGSDSLRTSKPDAVTAPPAEPASKSPRIQRYRAQTTDAYLVMGFPAPAASEFKDVCALDIVLAMMGNTHRGRVSSALNASKVRFSKVTTDFISQKYPTLFYVYVSVDPADLEEAAKVVFAEFRRFTTDALSPEDLSEAKGRVIGSDLYDQETFSGQARSLGLYQSIASYDLALNYGPTVQTLTSADVTSAARKYFAGDNFCILTVGPWLP